MAAVLEYIRGCEREHGQFVHGAGNGSLELLDIP
jgi:hypothetical protein